MRSLFSSSYFWINLHHVKICGLENLSGRKKKQDYWKNVFEHEWVVTIEPSITQFLPGVNCSINFRCIKWRHVVSAKNKEISCFRSRNWRGLSMPFRQKARNRFSQIMSLSMWSVCQYHKKTSTILKNKYLIKIFFCIKVRNLILLWLWNHTTSWWIVANLIIYSSMVKLF